MIKRITDIQLPDGTTVVKTSFLVDESDTMERERRLNEQQGHRQLGVKVNARDHTEKREPAPEGELQNDILAHPELENRQDLDGYDPNVSPAPPLNTDARREFDNERREQEMEKQLRLGNMPKFTAPRPNQP
ncbi:putative Smr domain protein (plasmid) [Legionella adelaidensis]|uniref:Putative Smr domain protein n=1 Tax=Legionella adelaidensis TaxID=45056 RepID=A0A0W0R350_9GAMM|nr:hypothetical protein [Legionella adelaidensis]KTC65454.1 putative Smr domain protein [Legionella adelaidensis]VEH84725.1 putative Smr domain protein [Legionella adelaidensis]